MSEFPVWTYTKDKGCVVVEYANRNRALGADPNDSLDKAEAYRRIAQLCKEAERRNV